MATQDDDEQLGVVTAVLIGAILLAVGLAVGIGLYRTGQGAGPDGGSPVTAAAVVNGATTFGSANSQEAPAAGVGDAASVRVEGDVVKFYFASGKTEIAAGAAEALSEVVKGVAVGKKAVISGFHDTTGDPALNEELARLRAFAVRDALMALGIGEDKLELKKPEVGTASGTNAEARRVEVTLE